MQGLLVQTSYLRLPSPTNQPTNQPSVFCQCLTHLVSFLIVKQCSIHIYPDGPQESFFMLLRTSGLLEQYLLLSQEGLWDNLSWIHSHSERTGVFFVCLFLILFRLSYFWSENVLNLVPFPTEQCFLLNQTTSWNKVLLIQRYASRGRKDKQIQDLKSSDWISIVRK